MKSLSVTVALPTGTVAVPRMDAARVRASSCFVGHNSWLLGSQDLFRVVLMEADGWMVTQTC